MKKPRIKKSLSPLLASREQAERVLGEITELHIQRDEHLNEMNAAIAAIREQHEKPLAEIGKALDEKTELLRAWAEANPAEFGRRKSLDLTHGRVGFRTGTPKLKTLTGWTFARVLEAVLRSTWEKSWLRRKIELDKERILAAHSTGEVADSTLKDFGLRVVQEETFFVEPKLEIAQEAA